MVEEMGGCEDGSVDPAPTGPRLDTVWFAMKVVLDVTVGGPDGSWVLALLATDSDATETARLARSDVMLILLSNPGN